RIDNTFHRPAGKGFIADKRRLEWISCNQAGHEPNRRSGIAGIQVARGWLWSVESASFNRDCVGFTPYRNASTSQALNCARAICTLGEIPDDGVAMSDCADHREPMADRFVSRNGCNSADLLCWRDLQPTRVIHGLRLAWSLTLKNPRVT